jgi:hypothetical protein
MPAAAGGLPIQGAALVVQCMYVSVADGVVSL